MHTSSSTDPFPRADTYGRLPAAASSGLDRSRDFEMADYENHFRIYQDSQKCKCVPMVGHRTDMIMSGLVTTAKAACVCVWVMFGAVLRYLRVYVYEYAEHV